MNVMDNDIILPRPGGDQDQEFDDYDSDDDVSGVLDSNDLSKINIQKNPPALIEKRTSHLLST